jgi:hypothetical protein
LLGGETSKPGAQLRVSDEAIDLALKGFCEPGTKLCPPLPATRARKSLSNGVLVRRRVLRFENTLANVCKGLLHPLHPNGPEEGEACSVRFVEFRETIEPIVASGEKLGMVCQRA